MPPDVENLPVSDLPRCAKDDARTRLRCVDCGDPICPNCMVRTDVGQKCEQDAAPAAARVSDADAEKTAARRRALPAILALVVGTVAIVAATALLAGRDDGAAPQPAASVGTWETAAPLGAIRGSTSAVAAGDGQVLAVGGGVGSVPVGEVELTSAGEGWQTSGQLATPRRGHRAVVLADDRIMVIGGIGEVGLLASAEIAPGPDADFDPVASADRVRLGHSATVLRDGRVLVLGGSDPESEEVLTGRQSIAPTASAEIYDPADDEWTSAGSMQHARFEHTATLLPDGRVLIVGGLGVVDDEIQALAVVELFDPATETFSRTGDLGTSRANHTASVLEDGSILVTGGADVDTAIATTERYTPDRGAWSTAGELSQAREGHTATVLPGGDVLVAGGEFFVGGSRRSLTAAERFRTAEETWVGAGEMACPRSEHAAVLTEDGTVLVIAGDAAFPGEPPMAQSCVDRYVP